MNPFIGNQCLINNKSSKYFSNGHELLKHLKDAIRNFSVFDYVKVNNEKSVSRFYDNVGASSAWSNEASSSPKKRNQEFQNEKENEELKFSFYNFKKIKTSDKSLTSYRNKSDHEYDTDSDSDSDLELNQDEVKPETSRNCKCVEFRDETRQNIFKNIIPKFEQIEYDLQKFPQSQQVEVKKAEKNDILYQNDGAKKTESEDTKCKKFIKIIF